jgi:hypothetical protein
MIQFVCDTCGAVKQPDEAWIVGHAAEAVGAVSARREVTIQSVWDRTNTLPSLAVHFCSVQCKDEYMTQLFGAEPRVQEIVVERTAPAEFVVERVVPERSIVTTKSTKARRRKRIA